MHQVGPESHGRDRQVGRSGPLLPVVFREPLPAVEDRGERDHARPGLDCVERLAVLAPEPEVPVRDGKQMVRAEHRRGGHHERRADPRRVRGAPEELAPRLRVARDARDARLPEVQPRLVDGCDLEQVEGRRVEQEEGEVVGPPEQRVDPGGASDVPERRAVVAVVYEVGDGGGSQRQREPGEEHPPGSSADGRLAPGPEEGEARVQHGKGGELQDHRRRRVPARGVLEKADPAASEASVRAQPGEPEDDHDDGELGAEEEPAREGLGGEVEESGVLADELERRRRGWGR